MWIDRRKRHSITVRLDEIELGIVKDIADALEVPLGEALRRAIWVFTILYDDNLKAKDALKENFDPNAPLADALRPIPELAHILRVELRIWRKQQLGSNGSAVSHQG